MSSVSSWSTTAASNNSAAPDGWPEGMAPSSVNDAAREMMAAIASWYQDQRASLVTTGSSNAYVLTTNMTHTALNQINLMAVRFNHTNTGAATLAVDGLTAKNIVLANSGTLSANDIVANDVGLITYDANGDQFFLFRSQSAAASQLTNIHGADIASAATINLTTATGDLVDVTGTTTITAITLAEGQSRTVRFTGALTLTHGASLLLPGAASIKTAAGDFAIFRGYAAGVVRCVHYSMSQSIPTVTQVSSGSDISTTSGSFVDITGLTTTFTPRTSKIRVTMTVPMYMSANYGYLAINVGGSDSSILGVHAAAVHETRSISADFSVTAGSSVTVKGRYRTSDGVSTLYLYMGTYATGILLVQDIGPERIG